MKLFRIGRRMTLLERQRRESFMKGMFIPFMLLALVCSLFGDTNILHADVQKVVAGFVEVTVPRALRFPELEQFSDGHETVPFPLELSNGFLEHERRSLGHQVSMEQDNRAGPHLPGHPPHPYRGPRCPAAFPQPRSTGSPAGPRAQAVQAPCPYICRKASGTTLRLPAARRCALPPRALFRISSRNSSYSACVQRICSNMAFSLIMPKLPCDHP